MKINELEKRKESGIKMTGLLSYYFCYNYSTGIDYYTNGLTEKGRLYLQFAILSDII